MHNIVKINPFVVTAYVDVFSLRFPETGFSQYIDWIVWDLNLQISVFLVLSSNSLILFQSELSAFLIRCGGVWELDIGIGIIRGGGVDRYLGRGMNGPMIGFHIT